MKKLLISFIVLFAIMTLASCGGQKTHTVIFADDVKPSIVYSRAYSTETDREVYNELALKLRDLLPGGFLHNTDETERFCTEIVIGKTTRTVSVAAEKYLNNNTTGDADTASFVIYVADESVAILANCELAMEFAFEYFTENFLAATSLSLPVDFVYFSQFSISGYYADLEAAKDAEYLAEFEKRWEEVESKLDQDGAEALKQLYAYYGTEWAYWLYNLYDPETGAFYYSNSARDYTGFLPDCESTDQALGMLLNAGLFERYGNDWITALPEQMRTLLTAFIQSLQDKNDGYFYHPQWGKDINTSRRGRDLNQCLSILRRLGAKPLYATALDRLENKGTAAVIEEFISATIPASFLDSEEEMLVYLESLKINENSYSFGHTISSQTSQIVAAGLGDFVCDYIDAHQNPETGLWEEEANYQSASGVIKISSFYSSIRGAIKYGDKMLDSIIGVVLSDEDSSAQITYVYNPWGALSSAMGSIRAGKDTALISASQQKIYDALPEMIEKTIEKLEQYRKDDGSFSYYPDRSAPTTQGVSVSLGYDEGDVNGTCCAMNYIIKSIFSALNLDVVPMLGLDDYKMFRETIENLSPVVKIAIDIQTPLDFEDGEIPTRITEPSEGSGACKVVADPKDATNSALRLTSGSGTGTAMIVDASNVYTQLSMFSASFDILVESADAALTHQISICNSKSNNRKAYMIEMSVGGGILSFSDSSSEAAGAIKCDLGITDFVGEWVNIRIEYYPDGEGGANIKVYKNDTCVFISCNHYDVQKGSKALSSVDRLRIYAMRSPASSVLFDNFSFDASITATFSSSDLKEGAGTVVEPDKVVGDVVDFESGLPSSFKTTSSSFSVANVPTASNPNNSALLLDSAAGNYAAISYSLSKGLAECSAFAFEADLRIDASSSDYTAQILLYNGNKPVYLLTVGMSGDKIAIGDCVSTAGGTRTDLGIRADVGEWFRLRIEFYLLGDNTAKIKAYKNGTLAGTSTSYYDCHKDFAPEVTFNKVMINSMTKPDLKLAIDNITAVHYKSLEYSED